MSAARFRFALVPSTVAALAASSAEGLVLAERGVGAVPVVVSAAASPAVKHAASDYVHYVELMTGTKPVRMTDAAELPARALVIGPTRFSPSAGPALGTDGFRLLVKDGRLFAVGSDVRGALYAVQEVLERFGGVGWYASWREVVPDRKRFEVPDDLDDTQVPAFEMRYTYWADTFGYWRVFGSRLRNNGCVKPPDYGGCHSRFGGGLRSCHTFDLLIPYAQYGEAHPEYFALRDGVRYRPKDGRGTQPCLTNPDVFRIVVSNVLERIRKDPTANLYGVSQNDNANYCQCPACAAVDDEEESHAGTVIRFVNAVAAEVEKEFPEAVIETLAYVYSRKPPKKTRVRHNVMPCLCTVECDFLRPFGESRWKSNVAFEDDIRRWSGQTDRLYLWNYCVNFRHYLHAFPNVQAMARNYRFFRDSKVRYFFEQGHEQGLHAEFGELKAWLSAKLMWNPDQPVAPLLRRFFSGYYGPAAKDVERYFSSLYAHANEGNAVAGIYNAPDRVYPDSFLDEADRIWDAAERATVSVDPGAWTNVVNTRLTTDYTRLHRGYGSEAQLAAASRRLEAALATGKIRLGESENWNRQDLEAVRRWKRLAGRPVP